MGNPTVVVNFIYAQSCIGVLGWTRAIMLILMLMLNVSTCFAKLECSDIGTFDLPHTLFKIHSQFSPVLTQITKLGIPVLVVDINREE
jgi:hypothetical protein